ncbi:MAG: hypothetical protein WC382_11435 [Methanoregulaceae archaeon]|jgi:hypothetical protein
MKAISLFIVGIAALAVIGAAVLLVPTSEPPFTSPPPPPVEFRIETHSYNDTITFRYIPSYDHSPPDDAPRPYSVSYSFLENGNTRDAIDQVRYELSTMEPLELSFPRNPEHPSTLTMVIRSPDGRALHTSTTTIWPGETGGSASQRVFVAG